MSKNDKPTNKAKAKAATAKQPAKPAKQADAAGTPEAKAEAKPKRPVFVAPPKPGGNYPGAPGGGKAGGPKPHSNMPKGRIFRHQGR